ncbi:hypothetical protein HYX12_00575 [Candidatus Woesearchaeota archaeon]|nr:hypothetical protein [Candidatus Woesearchaeota archaeon]
MTMSKRDLEKRQKEWKSGLAALEAKCQGGSGTKEDYEQLAKMKRRMK